MVINTCREIFAVGRYAAQYSTISFRKIRGCNEAFISIIKRVVINGLLVAVFLFSKLNLLPLFNHLKYLPVYFGIITHYVFYDAKLYALKFSDKMWLGGELS